MMNNADKLCVQNYEGIKAGYENEQKNLNGRIKEKDKKIKSNKINI